MVELESEEEAGSEEESDGTWLEDNGGHAE